jgi:hypothetical protein
LARAWAISSINSRTVLISRSLVTGISIDRLPLEEMLKCLVLGPLSAANSAVISPAWTFVVKRQNPPTNALVRIARHDKDEQRFSFRKIL